MAQQLSAGEACSCRAMIVRNFSSTVSSSDIVQLFKKFGCVTTVKMNKDNPEDLWAYVRFRYLSDLKKVFAENAREPFLLRSCKLSISAVCPTRLDNINDLPPEMLAKILSDQIFCVRDKLMNESVCKQWQNVIQRYCWKIPIFHRGLFKNERDVTDDMLTSIIKRCGPSVEQFLWKDRLEKQNFGPDMFKILGQYCPNISTLSLYNIALIDDKFKAIFVNGTKLKRLILRNSKFSEDCAEHLQGYLDLCENIEVLDIQGNEGILQDFVYIPAKCDQLKTVFVRDNKLLIPESMNALTKCESLVRVAFISCRLDNTSLTYLFKHVSSNLISVALSRCSGLLYSDLDFRRLSNLKALVITNNIDIRWLENDLKNILSCCSALHTLNISGTWLTPGGVQAIASHKNIRNLDLSNMSYEERFNDELIHVAELGQLTTLQIRNYRGLDDDTCIQIVEKCNDLKLLDIAGCRSLTYRTMTALKLMNRETRLVVYAGSTEISKPLNTEKLVVRSINRGQLLDFSAIPFQSPEGSLFSLV